MDGLIVYHVTPGSHSGAEIPGKKLYMKSGRRPVEGLGRIFGPTCLARVQITSEVPAKGDSKTNDQKSVKT